MSERRANSQNDQRQKSNRLVSKFIINNGKLSEQTEEETPSQTQKTEIKDQFPMLRPNTHAGITNVQLIRKRKLVVKEDIQKHDKTHLIETIRHLKKQINMQNQLIIQYKTTIAEQSSKVRRRFLLDGMLAGSLNSK